MESLSALSVGHHEIVHAVLLSVFKTKQAIISLIQERVIYAWCGIYYLGKCIRERTVSCTLSTNT